jgi:uncharacterized phage protein gp47/JayE
MAQGPNGFARKTLTELIEQAQADIDANLPGANARLEQSNLDVLSITSAGLADEQLDAIEFFAKQIHVTTATGVGLGRHASEWAVPRKEASRAVGVLRATLTGNLVPLYSGALFRDDAGVQIRTTADAIPVGGALQAPTEAVVPGSAGNLAPGTLLTTVNPIVGISGASVLGLMIGGADLELQEPWRSRILDRIQRPPQGGAVSDYERWCLAFPGVTRIWVAAKEQGSGTVVLRFAMDNTYPGGIPTLADAAALLAYVEPLRPVTAEVFVYVAIPRPINVTIRDLTPRTPQTDQAVADELRDMLFREGEPGGTIAINWIWEAVSIASGVRTHKIDDPPDDVVLLRGELPVLGTITYVPP